MDNQWRPEKLFGILPLPEWILEMFEEGKRNHPERFPDGLPWKTYLETVNVFWWVFLLTNVALIVFFTTR